MVAPRAKKGHPGGVERVSRHLVSLPLGPRHLVPFADRRNRDASRHFSSRPLPSPTPVHKAHGSRHLVPMTSRLSLLHSAVIRGSAVISLGPYGGGGLGLHGRHWGVSRGPWPEPSLRLLKKNIWSTNHNHFQITTFLINVFLLILCFYPKYFLS